MTPSHVTLEPLIEIEPREHVRPSPTASGADDPDGWRAWWQDCLMARGFPRLEPVEGSWKAELSALDDQSLLLVLDDQNEEWRSTPVDASEMSPLAGGLALRIGGEWKVMPECCGDLSNLREWRGALVQPQHERRMLWIGHPWRHVWRIGDSLELSPRTDANEYDGAPELVTSCAALGPAVAVAQHHLEALARRLERLLVNHGQPIEGARTLSRQLAGVADVPPTG